MDEELKNNSDVGSGSVSGRRGIDSAAGVRMAFQHIMQWISETLNDCEVIADPQHLIMHIVCGEKKAVVAVKTGCSVLGYKSYDDVWSVLPGIDYVFYCREIAADKPVCDQFKVFSRDEFLNMWESLGLIRKKMSGAALKKFKLIYGAEAKPKTEIYADTIGVQSFNNSGKKSAMVAEYLEHMPCLSKIELASLCS